MDEEILPQQVIESSLRKYISAMDFLPRTEIFTKMASDGKLLPYYIEFYGCHNIKDRRRFQEVLRKSGFTIKDEKIDFKTNVVKFYLSVDVLNKKTFDLCLEKLKKTEEWFDSSWKLTLKN